MLYECQDYDVTLVLAGGILFSHGFVRPLARSMRIVSLAKDAQIQRGGSESQTRLLRSASD